MFYMILTWISLHVVDGFKLWMLKLSDFFVYVLTRSPQTCGEKQPAADGNML